jgi:signal transduction histidine kinase
VPDLDTLQAECDALRRDQAVLALGLSHDVRAPLRAIESFSYLLERNVAQLDDETRDQAHRIREASARLARLVSRLQAYLQIGTAPFRASDIDPAILVDWCIGELRDAMPTRDAEVDIDTLPGVRGDERLLKFALDELLHNAWRFAHDDRPVRVRIEATRDGDGTTLRITDTGIGFDPARAARLGEPVQRLHPDTHPDGTGLGLAIVRRIANRHGGRLSIEGRAGEGVVVALFLPNDLPNAAP